MTRQALVPRLFSRQFAVVSRALPHVVAGFAASPIRREPFRNFCILFASSRVFVLVVNAVLGYLVLVIGFYLQVLGQLMLGALFAGLFDLVFRREQSRKSTTLGGRPVSSITHRHKGHKSELKVSSVVGAMDGRPVLLEISFRERFHHRTAIAWVDKPRLGEPLPTVTFVISPPDDDRGGGTYLIQVPDEQLGDFEEVENRKRVYRLTSVLYVEDPVSEDTRWE